MGYWRRRADAGAYPVDDHQSAGRAMAGQCGCGSVGKAQRDDVPRRRPGSTGYVLLIAFIKIFAFGTAASVLCNSCHIFQ